MNEENELIYVLSKVYFFQPDIARIADNAGLNPALIDFSGAAVRMWYAVLREAKLRGKVNDVFEVALQENPDALPLLAYKNKVNAAKVPDFEWKPTQIVANDARKVLPQGYEAIINQNQSTLLPIDFLSQGIIKAKAVCKIEIGSKVGTGWLLKNNYLVTNNHVIADEAEARQAQALFNYDNSNAEVTPYSFTPSVEKGFFTSDNLKEDYSIIKLDENPSEKHGFLNLRKISIPNNDFVNIIQHPNGLPKQIALYHNLVVHTDEKVIQYTTDTEGGSSGSPVFNSKWEVVALHHAYKVVKDSVDKLSIRNEGIQINTIIERLKNEGIFS